MTYAAILDEIDKLRTEVAAKADHEEESTYKLALIHCVKALRYAANAEGLSPTKRQEARSARRMAMAALGLEDDAA
jgi:hypothetical protein